LRRAPSGRSRSRLACLFVAYLALAAGALLKGPVGVVLPAAVVFVLRLVEGEMPRPWRLRRWARLAHELGLWWGVPLVLVVALPWFVWANAATGGELFEVFFWYHNVARGLGGGGLRGHPWYQYVGFFAVYFLPWSPLLLVAGWLTWRRRLWRGDPELRLGLVWFATVLVVLSCARFKRADYLLPAYPGAALFLGCVFVHVSRNATKACLVVLVVAALVWLWRVEWQLPREEPFRDYTAFAAVVRDHAPAPEPVLFFRTEAHALAFHTGRPLATLVGWEELAERLAQPGAHHVVLPPGAAAECARRLPGVALERLATNHGPDGRHERPLVLLRATPR
jgi:4-amino-4-deoxy-L-arabinose transferase-like glycosyltransferase